MDVMGLQYDGSSIDDIKMYSWGGIVETIGLRYTHLYIARMPLTNDFIIAFPFGRAKVYT